MCTLLPAIYYAPRRTIRADDQGYERINICNSCHELLKQAERRVMRLWRKVPSDLKSLSFLEAGCNFPVNDEFLH